MTIRRVYIGWDPREQAAYDVAVKSLLKRASDPVDIIKLQLDRLQSHGLLSHKRFSYRRNNVTGAEQLWDSVSEAYCSTEFAVSRFIVPLLAHTGWVLFVDCDVVFLADVRDLFALADDRYACMVVKHSHSPSSEVKMDGQVQHAYPRKNWTSVALYNCDHPATRRLTLGMINHIAGRSMHRLPWLNDDEIGELPAEWNWLVGEQQKPDTPKIAHYTLGGPFTKDWQGGPHDDLWLKEHDD